MPTSPTDRIDYAHHLDYELGDYVEASTPEALKALGDGTRRAILDLLLDRAATTSQLAEALDKPKGTVGYHLKVLESVGLIRVVRTRPVRAMTEKYYGRVARTIVIRGSASGAEQFPMLAEALGEARILDEGDALPMFTIRHVRVPADRALEFSHRIVALAEDFVDLPRGGDVVYGFIAGIYPTDRPRFKEDAPVGADSAVGVGDPDRIAMSREAKSREGGETEG